MQYDHEKLRLYFKREINLFPFTFNVAASPQQGLHNCMPQDSIFTFFLK